MSGVVFLILLLLGLPLAFTLIASGMVYFAQNPELPTAVAVQRMVAASQSFPLLAVPFFILAGHVMNCSGITNSCFEFAGCLDKRRTRPRDHCAQRINGRCVWFGNSRRGNAGPNPRRANAGIRAE